MVGSHVFIVVLCVFLVILCLVSNHFACLCSRNRVSLHLFVAILCLLHRTIIKTVFVMWTRIFFHLLLNFVLHENSL